MGNHPGRTPDDHRPLHVSAPKKRAAGIPAVISSAQHGIRRMGVRRTWKTLRTVNQQEGLTAQDALGLILNTALDSSFAKTERRRSQRKPCPPASHPSALLQSRLQTGHT